MDIKCEQAQELLSAYIDGELNAEESDLVKAHIETCQKCSIELAELKKVMSAVRGLPRKAAPDNILRAIQTEIEAGEKGDAAAFTRHRKTLTYTSAIAAVILLSFIIYIALMQTADTIAPLNPSHPDAKKAPKSERHMESSGKFVEEDASDMKRTNTDTKLKTATAIMPSAKDEGALQPLAVIINSESPYEDYMKVINLINSMQLPTESEEIQAQSGISKVALTITRIQLDDLMVKMKGLALNYNIENKQNLSVMGGGKKSEMDDLNEEVKKIDMAKTEAGSSSASQPPPQAKAKEQPSKEPTTTPKTLAGSIDKEQKDKSGEKFYLSPVKYKVEIYFKKAMVKEIVPK